jgi:peptide/nickel transport system substrate-binding protein
MAMAACTTGSNEPAGPARTKVAVAMASDVTALDPHKGNVAADYMMGRMLYESLLHRDDGGKLVAGLASKWTATATSAELTLRDDITCTDGQKVNATAVANSLKRYADVATGAPSRPQVFGAGNEVTITADDAAKTVSVKLKNPWSDLLMGLTLPQSGIICPAGLANPQLIKDGAKGAGTGAYYVTEAKPGTGYTLAYREGYKWPVFAKMPEGTVPATVEMRIVTNESTMANEMLTGTLDYAGITGADVARFTDKTADYNLVPAPIIRMWVAFNERAGKPAADIAVREAVAKAIDRTAFNNAVTRGSGQLIASFADKAIPCASSDESLLKKFDTAAASTTLKGKKFTVVGTNGVANGAGTEYVQAALKAAGAEVTLRNVDLATWSTEVIGNKGEWDITVMPNLNLTNLLTTPASFFTGAEPPNGRNFGAVNDPGFSASFAKAMATTNDSEKCGAWADAQKSLLSSTHIVPLATVNVYYITYKNVTAIAPDGLFDPSTMRILK